MLKSFKDMLSETAPKVVKTKSGHWQVMVHGGPKKGYVPHGEPHKSESVAKRATWGVHTKPRTTDEIMFGRNEETEQIDEILQRAPVEAKMTKRQKWELSKKVEEVRFQNRLADMDRKPQKQISDYSDEYWRDHFKAITPKNEERSVNVVGSPMMDQVGARNVEPYPTETRKKKKKLKYEERMDEIGDTEMGRMVLGQYRDKARKDMFSQRDMADDAYIANQHARSDKHDDRADKRMHGMMVAKNRLGKKTPSWLSKKFGTGKKK